MSSAWLAVSIFLDAMFFWLFALLFVASLIRGDRWSPWVFLVAACVNLYGCVQDVEQTIASPAREESESTAD